MWTLYLNTWIDKPQFVIHDNWFWLNVVNFFLLCFCYFELFPLFSEIQYFFIFLWMAASREQQYKLLFETVIFHKRILEVYFNVGICLFQIFSTWIPSILMLSFFLFFFFTINLVISNEQNPKHSKHWNSFQNKIKNICSISSRQTW